ncbi:MULTISPECIES: CidA/LrgA family protein [Burkholderia]|jgi:holin-like protein|uniref:Murein hydrolase transporter LrgA n=1 Tax=Burkholderia vietnamiensis TaxID=60552 RepID=A0A132DAJ6_BURVI|nr:MULTISPECIES: CidA/LrgA family protein [Burkholderia]KVF33011.1 murein hydrolase transporter LrgA [Burkholderia vietnamiensis]KVF41465.1 murein hydrolase transporter LrgA [Burkholderia vietnamiensis]KVF62951.1 murein hydrolase transporter LrgA [Burkholderia vietnamiensis]KVG00703.1 murein hydrolase transporter LrgA [Burkholderia vietnamiensis]KVR69854.1 murein hydrolase transporter LrgA [Burkholderia vietnamiensis]
MSHSTASVAVLPATPGKLTRTGRIALQSAALGVLWLAVDWAVRAVGLPVPSGVVGLAVLLVLLFSGRVAPAWVKDGANWLLSDMLLFFVPAAVAAVQYGGLFREDGWRIALVMLAGTAFVMVAVAVAVDLAAKLERRLAAQRMFAERRRARLASVSVH